MQPQQHGPQSVQHLLREAHSALAASNAPQALQCVVQALKLLQGDNAVLPALRAAAESYHAHKAATVNDLAQLLAQVTLAADQDMHVEQHQEQPAPQQQMWQQQQQQQQQQQYDWLQQQQNQQQPPGWGPGQQQQQQLMHGHHISAADRPILEETGRAEFAEAAMADGSSWQCPHCAGVVPVQRQQAHLTHWCPALQQTG